MSKYRIIKWRKFSEERPIISGDYICKISEAIAAVSLTYDRNSNTWTDDFDNHYRVTWWAVFPRLPEDRMRMTSDPLVRRFNLKLTAEEIVVFRENLSFILSYCDVPESLATSMRTLQTYFENIFADRR